MMGGVNEFNTAVRNCDLTVIVCNDAAYGAEHIQMIDRIWIPLLQNLSGHLLPLWQKRWEGMKSPRQKRWR